MIKVQTGFQVASYFYPEDYNNGLVRSEVQALQNNGWEVLQPISLGVRKNEGVDTDVLLIPMVKYEDSEVVEKRNRKKVVAEKEE